MLSIEETREYYKKLDDYKIMYLANNPKGLRKEFVPLLNDEIKKEILILNLLNGLNTKQTILKNLN